MIEYELELDASIWRYVALEIMAIWYTFKKYSTPGRKCANADVEGSGDCWKESFLKHVVKLLSYRMKSICNIKNKSIHATNASNFLIDSFVSAVAATLK